MCYGGRSSGHIVEVYEVLRVCVVFAVGVVYICTSRLGYQYWYIAGFVCVVCSSVVVVGRD